jgi:pimeloyl-ACP methyl ester carboxylesterase
MDGTGELFDEFVGALAPDIAPIVVRYPTDTACDYEALEALVTEALPRKGPFILLGESFSGPVAVAVAATRPGGLVGLILVCSFVRAPRAVPRAVRSLVTAFPFWRVPIWVGAGSVLGRFNSATLRARLKSAVSRVSPVAWSARLRAVCEVDVSSQLASLTIPVLYLRADTDRVVPRSAGDLIRALLPQTKLVEIHGPHQLLQACPAESAKAVRQFAQGERIAL